MSVTVAQLVTDILFEAMVIGLGETPTSDQSDLAINSLQRLMNLWNADKSTIWSMQFPEFTFTPSLSPHTIGPSGATFTVTGQRPVALLGANVLLNNVSPVVNTPIMIRDWQWWQNQSIPSLTIPYPTDVYYSPDWPLGKLYFWPIPTVAYGVQLVLPNVLDDTLAVGDTLDMPPGYQDALTFTGAERVAGIFGKELLPRISQLAREARAKIWNNNDPPMRFMTADAGMSPGKGRPYFNWRTGLTVPRMG